MAKKIVGEDGKIYYEKGKPNVFIGCLATVAIFFFFLIIGGVATTFMAGKINQGIQKEISGATDESEYITLEEFNKIKIGMTYENVKNIVGGAGKVGVESGNGKYKITVITWYGNGTAGSSGNVTFQNNKVIAKAQAGLK